jgi:membrane protease YdiL (CAAX protease family)
VSSSLIAVDYFSNPEHYQDNFNLQPFLILCVIAVILVPLQTSFEEYFFRGYLMQGIGVWSENKRFPFVFCYLVIAITSYILLTKYFGLGILLKLLLIIIKIGIFFFLNSDFFLNTFIESKWYNVFYKLLNRASTPLLFTSASFGLLHIANPEIEKLGYILLVYYIGTGLFLGIITLMDDGLELALGFHLANNLFTALLVTADWTAFQTHSIFKDISEPTEAGFIDVFLPVFFIFPFVLFVFAKKYKWTNWKEKLFGKVEKPIEDYKILED